MRHLCNVADPSRVHPTKPLRAVAPRTAESTPRTPFQSLDAAGRWQAPDTPSLLGQPSTHALRQTKFAKQ